MQICGVLSRCTETDAIVDFPEVFCDSYGKTVSQKTRPGQYKSEIRWFVICAECFVSFDCFLWFEFVFVGTEAEFSDGSTQAPQSKGTRPHIYIYIYIYIDIGVRIALTGYVVTGWVEGWWSWNYFSVTTSLTRISGIHRNMRTYLDLTTFLL